MPEIQVRPINNDDYEQLEEIDHNYHTDHVWQMERNFENKKITISFREIRLPRTIRVEYPKFRWSKEIENSTYLKGIAAVIDNELIGYLLIEKQAVTRIAFVRNLVVKNKDRRQGVASALLLSAHDWAGKNQLKHVIIEMQSKNYPAICLAQKFGYEFCGYNDHFYSNQDIALFFARYSR